LRFSTGRWVSVPNPDPHDAALVLVELADSAAASAVVLLAAVMELLVPVLVAAELPLI
jgi:hypothetical protein